jgi:hypothetical protein
MSYGYRVGQLLVDDDGELKRWLLLLPRLLAIGFDMLTRRGRRKEEARKKALAAEHGRALWAHSERVLASRQFRAGVTLMEAVTKGTPSLRRLPLQIRRIRNGRG